MPVNNSFTLPYVTEIPMPKNPLTVVRSKTALRDVINNVRNSGHTIGFVPTMGALHNGHLSLIALAGERCTKTVTSIFVNPTQFAPGEDFESYPRREADDLTKLEHAGCDLVYIPSAGELYPAGNCTEVRVEGLSDLLDGQYRPHFFYGVSTVVARLLIQVMPDAAVFGQKDFQQLQIIRRMVRDLSLPVEIVGAPTVRDNDGLAQSSRNEYLSSAERRLASQIQATLHRARVRILAGGSISGSLKRAEDALRRAGFDVVDYVSAVRNADLSALEDNAPLPEQSRLLAAAWLGNTRLIDNIALTGEA